MVGSLVLFLLKFTNIQYKLWLLKVTKEYTPWHCHDLLLIWLDSVHDFLMVNLDLFWYIWLIIKN